MGSAYEKKNNLPNPFLQCLRVYSDFSSSGVIYWTGYLRTYELYNSVDVEQTGALEEWKNCRLHYFNSLSLPPHAGL